MRRNIMIRETDIWFPVYSVCTHGNLPNYVRSQKLCSRASYDLL